MGKGKREKNDKYKGIHRRDSTYNWRHLEWLEILKEIRIGNLLGRPLALVVGILDHRCTPLALVVGIGYERRLPLATAGGLLAHGIVHQRSLPFAIDFGIPVFRLAGRRVKDHVRLLLQPTIGHNGIGIGQLGWGILIPIVGLVGGGIWDLLTLIPRVRLLVIGVIDLRWRIHSWLEVGQQRALVDDLVIHANLKAVVGSHHQLVEMGQLVLEGLF